MTEYRELKTSDFDYKLPAECIAQTPMEPRDHSKLLVLNRNYGAISHDYFYNLPQLLVPGDVMVFNDSRVLPARFYGTKLGTGGKVELLLLTRRQPNVWEALVKPAKRLKPGTQFQIGNNANNTVLAEITSAGDDGIRIITFSDETRLLGLGKIPLPPYIHTPLGNSERYQTVYAKEPGSAAAPTAGLHFTKSLIQQLTDKGIQCLYVTLHVGLDTFRPVSEQDPRQHIIHREYGVVTPEVAQSLAQAKQEGRRIIAIGTTSVRILEALARKPQIEGFSGWVDLFILPGHRFRLVDTMITNFHLPCSSLLMLVCAFAGKDLIMHAYQEAMAQQYRFYSFGDAMLIV